MTVTIPAPTLAVNQTPNDFTLETYERTAALYIDKSRKPEATPALTEFAASIKKAGSGTRVLEIGSGSGDQADQLAALGLSVTRSDAAQAFIDLLEARGVTAQKLNVVADDLGTSWDGIYANAVFVHLDRAQFAAVLHRSVAALKVGGTLAFTLTKGEGEAWSEVKVDAPRFFCLWTEEKLSACWLPSRMPRSTRSGRPRVQTVSPCSSRASEVHSAVGWQT